MDEMERIKMSLLKDKVDILRQSAELQGRFSLFHLNFVYDTFKNCDNYSYMESMFDLVNGWEEYCNMPYEVGMTLSKQASEEDTIICINRIRLDVDTSKPGLPDSTKLNTIMENGLINYGHGNAVGGGAVHNDGPPDLSLVVCPLIGLAGYINLVSSYKNNDAVIIMSFPKDLVDEQSHIRTGVDPSIIYNMSGFNPIVKPEYIAGVILKKSNGRDEFYTRNEIINSKNKASGNGK